MGCCNSTPRDDDRPLNPTPAAGPNDSSAPSQRTDTSQPSTFPSRHPQRSARPHASSRPVPPGEVFNRPLKLPKPYRSKHPRTRHSLDRLREEFFDTAITGRPEIWETLKAVTGFLRAGDVGSAQGFLDAAGCTLPDGDLVTGGAYDEMGNWYQLSREVVMDPENVIIEDLSANPAHGDQQKEFLPAEANSADDDDDDEDDDDADFQKEQRRREEKGKGLPPKLEDTILLKARLSDRGGPGADLRLRVGKQQSVRHIIRLVQEEAGLPKGGVVKFGYLGKVLGPGTTLVEAGYREGHVINAMVFS